jgi:hypothetical protein
MQLVQKGRSRTWLDDHGWWLCVVEFQPSSWSRGSYLNVGCCWLWQVKDYLSFDEGSRVEGFHDFQDQTQFAAVAEQLARRAAAEVERYRGLFPSIRAVADYYVRNPREDFWPSFNAAVACGVAGDADAARRFFRNVSDPQGDDPDWVLAAQADAKELDGAIGDLSRFRDIVASRVQRTRELQKLPIVVVDWDSGGPTPAP